MVESIVAGRKIQVPGIVYSLSYMKKHLQSALFPIRNAHTQQEALDGPVSGGTLPQTGTTLNQINLYKGHSPFYQVLTGQSIGLGKILTWFLKNKILLIGGLLLYIGCVVLILSGGFMGINVLKVKLAAALFSFIIIITICLTPRDFFLDILSRIFKKDKAEQVAADTDQPKYRTISLDVEKCKLYGEILENTMNATKVYLRPSLSLDELSAMTNIPRHHFSNFLNVYIGKTFYQYVSEYRIREAIFRIKNDDNITVESLAYECGFNSKTSFNRYFKDITGTTPSEYRKLRAE